ncbi:MAG: YbaB/EbfC family nucleoid-associated protein [Deltaproteobacteria bacterium]|jgi:DNA-binding YbaB/EbfC family protein|nr:YbaB/EbfC family nucleoid-associated protein [Deltaproteobacteria bacterium]
MTDKFDFSQLSSMLPSMGKMQEKMKNMESKLNKVLVTGESGGGLVKVTANANLKVKEIEIDQKLQEMDDPEMMCDLIAAAVNITLDKCKTKAQEVTVEELGPMASILKNSPFGGNI